MLKLKKYKEKELDNIDGQLLSVFKMIEDIEWETANLEVMKALKVGTEALNKIHEEMSVEDVEALLEETNEAIEVRTFISLSTSYSQMLSLIFSCVLCLLLCCFAIPNCLSILVILMIAFNR